MNIVVVTRYARDISTFINDATDWVLRNSVDRKLYSVGMGNNVRIGPYIIRFVYKTDPLLGCMIVGPRIDIAYYYHFPIEDSMAREIERRMAPSGEIYTNLHYFMKEIFWRAENEVTIAKKKLLNDIYGVKSVNYPEDFIANLRETIKKSNSLYGLPGHNEAYGTEIDRLNSGILRQCYLSTGLFKPNAIACIKEETTMNCDIRSNIKNVIFNYPATIILWKDGTKTIVKVRKGEKYDPEKGFAMAVCKKMFGNEGNYYKVFKEYVPIPYYIPEKNDIIVKDLDVAEETSKIIEDIIVKWRLKHKEWPGLTRRKWKELINKAAKRVEERRKREKAKADHKEKKKGIHSGKYPWGMYMSNYMTPPEDETNNSDGEE